MNLMKYVSAELLPELTLSGMKSMNKATMCSISVLAYFLG